MAYERLSDKKILGDDLDAFVQSRLMLFSRQAAIRNAEDETEFNRLVLEENLSLGDQLAYRKDQLARAEDRDERMRIRKEISSLTDRVEQKKFTDEYVDKIISHESGFTSIDGVISFLKERLSTATDETIKDKIRSSLAEQESKRFDMVQGVLRDQTSFALNDKTAKVIDEQMKRVGAARTKALLSGDEKLISGYDLQIQSLKKAKAEADIERASTSFSVGAVAGYQTATALLDSFNLKLAAADTDVPIDIGGTRYESAQQFWRYKRDEYIADGSANGFFGRFSEEQRTNINVRNSQNLLGSADLRNSAAAFDALASRPELQSYGVKITASKQDVLQGAADLRAKSIANNFAVDYDLNKAFGQLDEMTKLGVNVESTRIGILSDAGTLKQTQVNNLLAGAEQIRKDNPALTWEQAVAEAGKAGFAVVLSPTQLASQTETKVATDLAKGAEAGKTKEDPRLTASTKAAKVEPAAPPVIPTEQDLSSKYGIVGKAVYDKASGKAFTNEQEFFNAAGVTSFQNIKFDTAYTPPPANASPQLQATPASTPAAPAAAAPQMYKVNKGDTLAAISQRLLGDATRYKEIAALNKIKNPDIIQPGQELILPGK